jgi:hypothetical protein
VAAATLGAQRNSPELLRYAIHYVKESGLSQSRYPRLTNEGLGTMHARDRRAVDEVDIERMRHQLLASSILLCGNAKGDRKAA